MSDPAGRKNPTGDPAPGAIVAPPEMPPGWTTLEAAGDQIGEAERVEYEVFVEAGFCKRSDMGRVTEFDPWRDMSEFVVVTSPDGEIRGVVRVTLGNYQELQIGSFEKDRPFPDPVLEYASLAVPDAARRTGVASWLYREVWQYAVRCNAAGVVGVGERWLMELLNTSYPFGFEQLGPSRWYMGGECFPMGARLIDLVQRSCLHPEFFDWATGSIDLRDVPVEPIRDVLVDMRSSRPASERSAGSSEPSQGGGST